MAGVKCNSAKTTVEASVKVNPVAQAVIDKIATKIFSLKKTESIIPRYFYFGEIHGINCKDQGFLVYFKNPQSYTGEDVVEIQAHGNLLLLEQIVKNCINHGARLAERGEFTQRAFYNGKISLDAAEGLLALIQAKNMHEIKASYALFSGTLKEEITKFQEILTNLSSQILVNLDYNEEVIF